MHNAHDMLDDLEQRFYKRFGFNRELFIETLTFAVEDLLRKKAKAFIDDSIGSYNATELVYVYGRLSRASRGGASAPSKERSVTVLRPKIPAQDPDRGTDDRLEGPGYPGQGEKEVSSDMPQEVSVPLPPEGIRVRGDKRKENSSVSRESKTARSSKKDNRTS